MLALSLVVTHAQAEPKNNKLPHKRRAIKKASATNGAALPAVTGKNGLIARVNNQGIPLTRFQEKYKRFTQTFRARKRAVPPNIDSRYRESIVKRLVEETLIAQESKRLKVKVNAKKLQREFEKYKRMFKTEERFQRYLKNARLTEEKVKANLRANLQLRALLEHISGKSISEADLKRYYESNKRKYQVREQVRARHILIKTPKKATPEQIAEAKAKADKIAAEAKSKNNDETFAALAKMHSEGPTASRGGDLSFFTRNRMVKEFDQKAFSMKVGEISDPVKTRFGWHIIRVVERKDKRLRSFEEVRDSIERTLNNRANRTARQKLIAKLRSKAKIEVYLPRKPKVTRSASSVPIKRKSITTKKKVYQRRKIKKKSTAESAQD
jgi:parvulin-like peptidyl-prolyl isomerase